MKYDVYFAKNQTNQTKSKTNKSGSKSKMDKIKVNKRQAATMLSMENKETIHIPLGLIVWIVSKGTISVIQTEMCGSIAVHVDIQYEKGKILNQ